jgi:diaminopimelate decarboxylase
MLRNWDLTWNKTIQTPAYIYDLDRLKKVVDSAKKAAGKRNYQVHYAVKANVEPAIFQVLKQAGFGADCVSGGEVQFASAQGISPSHIFYAGVGKTDVEINAALDLEIGAFNVEGLHELKVINELAQIRDKKARVALRINPNIEAGTHHYISTGKEENKFGFSALEWEQVFDFLKTANNIEFVGLHVHIGSQINNMKVFQSLCEVMNEYIDWLHNNGWEIPIINVGGGLGVDYENPDKDPDFETFFSVFEQNIKLKNYQELHFELGRSLVATCGSLATRALFVKNARNRKWLVVDAGMTELLRPALYNAFHHITSTKTTGEAQTCDVVGPICESSDTLGRDVQLPSPDRGDILLVHTVGAYGAVMRTNYNMRPTVSTYFYENKVLTKH